MKAKLLLHLCCLFLLIGCRDADRTTPEKNNIPARNNEQLQLPSKGCESCHPNTKPDPLHAFACTDCHLGNPDTGDRDGAHHIMIARPAHPDFMTEGCGKCHPGQLRDSTNSPHYTLSNKINLTRKHFSNSAAIDTLMEIPAAAPATLKELADDMLLRRCLRCHLYTAGDDYASTRRGTGCAACHFKLIEGKLESHQVFKKPDDYQCLSCHYGNRVGADFYGRFENDYNQEYRTPYTTREPFFRPYGVEFHDLAPDIHQQQGLSCIDCHNEHKGRTDTVLSCSSCHRPATEQDIPLPGHISIENGIYYLTLSSTGGKRPIPQLKHEAHTLYGERVACQVCHGQWGYNDATTHLLRSDTDDYVPWEQLIVQSSSEVERLLEHNLYSDDEEYPPAMRHGISGETIEGVWYKGFTQRRWENMIIRTDSDGVIKVFRPILDLRLSYVDNEENLIFDTVSGNGDGLLPYTPHTTGAAGLFYLTRFAHIMNKDPKQPVDQ